MIFDFECRFERAGCQAGAERFQLPLGHRISDPCGVPAPDTSRISPTAHYTSYVWFRNGLSHSAFATKRGRALYEAARLLDGLSSSVGGPTVEAMLLSRHHLIDRVLERAIESGAVRQVVEVAAGLSYRGVRFTRRFDDLLFIEGDLPGMSAQKRERLARAGLTGERHHVVALNALADAGEYAFDQVARAHLDPRAGTAIVTEGLLPYFAPEVVAAMWERFARMLRPYPAGLYVSDLYTRDTIGRVPGSRVALLGISAVARGGVHLHFDDAGHAARAAREAGFERCEVRDRGELSDLRLGRGAGLARVLEAWG
jgi:O-methyltransferase involved in polyketide biosynthesis